MKKQDLAMHPINIRKTKNDTLEIVWDNNHCSYFNLNELHKKCSCANCREARASSDDTPSSDGAFTVLKDNELLGHAQLLEASIVGNYAISFSWSAGCSKGIYTFEYLLSIEQPLKSSDD